MSPELVSELQARIAKLEPRQAELWAEVQRIEAEYKPRDEAARAAWAPVYREIEALRELLAKECAEGKASL